MLCACLWHAKVSSSAGSKFCCCMKALPSVGAAVAALQNLFGALATACSKNWSSIALFRLVVAAASASAASKSGVG